MTHIRNTLFYGDNLPILREYFADETVDLIYLDPPFNSNRHYRLVHNAENAAETVAFEDTWRWNPVIETQYHELTIKEDKLAQLLEVLIDVIGRNPMMTYLIMMSVRLIELYRILKPTGSLYLHCDTTASHYLKLVLDRFFGVDNYKNEIIWKRTTVHNDAKQGAKHFGRVHDILLFYVKNANQFTFNSLYFAYSEKYLKQAYSKVDAAGRRFKSSDLSAAKPGGDTAYLWKGIAPPKGRYWAFSKENMQKFAEEDRIYYSKGGKPYLKHYLDEMPGVSVQDVWDDIKPLNIPNTKRLGYPTQKPLALLERIIQASSNPGDRILDPFCGCGTTIHAAQQLGRNWVGIDSSDSAITLIKNRLWSVFGITAKQDYDFFSE
ncbi:MAG: hypothetical protein BWK79_02915 [Beggiatoa sp. IS2]|nr:MAG: hypothetical protein BWK79_02915 [Beggiatoa sp. IS2]